MKSNRITPTEVEHHLKADEYIISTANPKGRITSVNDVLVDYSGYSREELMNAQHNIIRHPDMPRSVFWLMWETLREGDDFYGYIKNLRKDGGFYWVFTHVLPVHDSEGDVVGYRSVRSAPRPGSVTAVDALYAQIRAAEAAVSAKESIPAGLTFLSRYLGDHGLSYEQWVARL